MGSEHEPKPAVGSIQYLSSIHVTSYENRVLAGWVYNPYFGEQPFRSTLELVMLMEAQMDQLEYPQHTVQCHSFSRNPKRPAALRHSRDGGSFWRHRFAAAFQLQIIFRQNASWQGKLTWPKNHTAQNFRSLLELLMLLDSALTEIFDESVAVTADSALATAGGAVLASADDRNPFDTVEGVQSGANGSTDESTAQKLNEMI